jgi:hypothetical protein
MRTRAAGLVGLALILVGGVVEAQDTPRAGHALTLPRREAKADDDALRRALVDRYNAAAELVEVSDAFFNQGQLTLDRLCDAVEAAERCELELCESPDEVVTVRERTLALARRVEERELARLQVGAAAMPNVAEARFRRRDAEVQLLRAKRAAAAPK